MVRDAPRNLGPCYARAPYVTIIKLWRLTVVRPPFLQTLIRALVQACYQLKKSGDKSSAYNNVTGHHRASPGITSEVEAWISGQLKTMSMLY